MVISTEQVKKVAQAIHDAAVAAHLEKIPAAVGGALPKFDELPSDVCDCMMGLANRALTDVAGIVAAHVESLKLSVAVGPAVVSAELTTRPGGDK